LEVSLQSCHLIDKPLLLLVHEGLCGILACNVVGYITDIPVDPVNISDILGSWSRTIEGVPHDIIVLNAKLNKSLQVLQTAFINDCSLLLGYLVEPSIGHALVDEGLVLVHIIRDSVNHLYSRLKLLRTNLVLELELWDSHDPLDPLLLQAILN
jgi:hypothetical protein